MTLTMAVVKDESANALDYPTEFPDRAWRLGQVAKGLIIGLKGSTNWLRGTASDPLYSLWDDLSHDGGG